MSGNHDHNLYSMKQAIGSMFQKFNMQQKANEMKIIAHWNEIVGKLIGNHTQQIYIKDRRLFLKIDSAPLRNELHNLKEGILDKVNEGFPNPIIIDLILIWWDSISFFSLWSLLAH